MEFMSILGLNCYGMWAMIPYYKKLMVSIGVKFLGAFKFFLYFGAVFNK